MERSDPPDPCKSTGSEPLVLLSENSYNSLTEGGWKASGYAHPIEERGSMPPAEFDRDITFNSTGIYSSCGSRPDVSGAVYSSWQGSEFVDQQYYYRDRDGSFLFDSFLSRDDDMDEVESPVRLDGEEPEVDCQIPLKGMVFMSEMDAEKFYYHYAEKIGFKVRKELHLEHNHDLESRNQRSNKNILDRDKLRLGVFSRNIRSKHVFEPVESQVTDSKRAEEEGLSKVHTPSILDEAEDVDQTIRDANNAAGVVHIMAAESFEGQKHNRLRPGDPQALPKLLRRERNYPPLHPKKVFIPPQPQEEKEDTMSSNLPDWVFTHGNKEIEGLRIAPTSAVHVQFLCLKAWLDFLLPSLQVGPPAPEKPILSSFSTVGSDSSPTIISSHELQGRRAPPTVENPTLPISTMTNASTLVPGSSNLQLPPQAEHQGILRDEESIPQIGPHAQAGSLAWIRETSIQVQGPGFSPAGYSILEQIFTKYGDITADCCFTAPQFRAQFLASIVKIVQLMQQHTARELSDADISFICSTLSDLERAQVKVDWLRTQFVTVGPLIHYAQAEAKRAMMLTRLSAMKVEMAQLEHELDQSEAILRGLKDQMPDWLGIEDKLGKGLL
ncbi:hypothetical protein CK203_094074 [Vitis vinifera]|uniref:Uncharacterized protein n=1 Tax=Vitis vinifera TaxID=29760 RepID=A0A438E171_VITVI|nr:hypothetical protein CK203_094074 [Vitis vinifera]